MTTTIRVMREEDIEWAVQLAKNRYDNRFDFDAAEMWFRNIVLRQPMVFFPIRSPDAFLIGMISVAPWAPSDWEATILVVCAEEGKIYQAVALLKASLAWAKRRKCTAWRLSSETAYDLEPLARRVGARALTPRFSVGLS